VLANEVKVLLKESRTVAGDAKHNGFRHLMAGKK
jgi:hypothetical protein